MTAVDLLEQARACGVHLIPLSDGGLKLRGKPPIPAKLTAALRVHKAEVLALLQAYAPLAEAYIAYWRLPESEPLERFQAAYAEIVKLEAQAEPLTAWRILRETARRWPVEAEVADDCDCSEDAVSLTRAVAP